jgi:hypothetical protein
VEIDPEEDHPFVGITGVEDLMNEVFSRARAVR